MLVQSLSSITLVATLAVVCASAALSTLYTVSTGDTVDVDFSLSSDGVYAGLVSSVDSRLTVISVTLGSKVLRTSVGTCKFSSTSTTLVSAPSNTLVAVVACSDSTLRGVNGMTGSELWSRPAPSIVIAPVAMQGSLLAFGGSSVASVTLLNSTTQFTTSPNPVWVSGASTRFAAAPLLYVNTTSGALPALVLAGDLSGSLRCFSGATGALRWAATAAGQLTFTPVVVSRPLPLGAIAVVASLGSSIQSFDLETGQSVWTVAMGSASANAPPVVVALPNGHNAVVHSRTDGVVSAVNATSGVLLWQNNVADSSVPISGVTIIFSNAQTSDVRITNALSSIADALSEPIICAASQAGDVVAISAITGHAFARDKLGTSINAPPRLSTSSTPMLLLLSSTSLISINVTAWVSTFTSTAAQSAGGGGTDGGIDGAVRVVVIVVPVVIVVAVLVVAIVAKVISASNRPPPQNDLPAMVVAPRTPPRAQEAGGRRAYPQSHETDHALEVLFVPRPAPEQQPASPVRPPSPAPASYQDDPEFEELVAALELNEPFASRVVSWRWFEWLCGDSTHPSLVPLPDWVDALDGCIVRKGRLHLLTLLRFPTARHTAMRQTTIYDKLEPFVFATARGDGNQMGLIIRGRGAPLSPSVAAMILTQAGEKALVRAAQANPTTTVATVRPLLTTATLLDTVILVYGPGSAFSALHMGRATDRREVATESSAAADVVSCDAELLRYASQEFSTRWEPSHIVTCSVCFGPVVPDSSEEGWRILGVCCTGGQSTRQHFACQLCVNNRLNALFDTDAIDPDHVPCSMTTECGGYWPLEDFVKCLNAATLRRWHSQTVEATSQRVLAGVQKKEATLAIQRHCDEIRALMRPRCPFCNLAFESYSGCAAVRCGVIGASRAEHRGCGRTFCGACLAPEPCAAGHGHAFLTAVELRACWNQWRVDNLKRYRDTRGLKGTSTWSDVMSALRADLGALGVNMSR